MKYCFIGTGNMAEAIIKGMILGKNKINPQNINTISKTNISAKNLSKLYNTNVFDNYKDAINNCNIIILAVKPNILSDVTKSIKDIVNKNTIIVSLAAGKKINYIENLLNDNMKIIRVMPNINAIVGCSVSAFCCNKNIEEKDKKLIIDIFESIGSIIEIEEEKFSAFSAIAGSSPAFSYLYIESLARAGVKNGFTKKQALQIAANSVLGSAKMILESGEHPFELIDKVCSPSGTTIEGLSYLLNNSFEGNIIKSIDEVIQKDYKISK